MFYHTVVASALPAAVCWGGSLTEKKQQAIRQASEKRKRKSRLSAEQETGYAKIYCMEEKGALKL